MLRGMRMVIRDKAALRDYGGVLRQAGKPMDILRTVPEDVKILHVVDLNAKSGNTTNLDLYDKMTYSRNIEVEAAPREEILKKLFALKARAVLDLPCTLDLGKFGEHARLLVGRTDGKERSGGVFDYYIETDDPKAVAKLAKEGGKRVLVRSNVMDEKEAEKAGAFALIRDY